MTGRKTERDSFWMALIAMIVSVVALGVSVYEAQIMREQQQIMYQEQHTNVWPYIKSSIGVSTSSEQVEVTVNIQNKGVGPAIINRARMNLRDNEINSYNDASELIGKELGLENLLSFSIDHNFKGVLSPNEEVQLYKLVLNPSIERPWTWVPTLDLCYCSSMMIVIN